MYYKNMKNLIYLLLTLTLSSYVVFAEEKVPDSKRSAYQILTESNQRQHDICKNLGKNFKDDHQFSTYLKNRCILFESDREQVLSIIYPYPNHRIKDYNAKFPYLMSAYTVNTNTNELNEIKNIVTEYCKYNSYKIAKKNPYACKPENLEEYFK